MKMNEELHVVLSTYAAVKGRMWSKTAKRILGVHLFGNRSLTSGWETTFRHWWDEVDLIESRYGYVPTLDAAKLPMGEFFESVMTTLHARGYLTSDEHKRMADSMDANRRSVFRPHDSYASPESRTVTTSFPFSRASINYG